MPDPVFAPKSHDHAACVAVALVRAEALCRSRGLRLTELRQAVLELVWDSHRPVGAYDLLEDLGKRRGRVAPPTVYRTLDFLVANGLVHRIESLNAFVGCAAGPGEPHDSSFLICTDCGRAAELDDPRIATAITETLQESGFRAQRRTIEVAGCCADCAAAGQDKMGQDK